MVPAAETGAGVFTLSSSGDVLAPGAHVMFSKTLIFPRLSMFFLDVLCPYCRTVLEHSQNSAQNQQLLPQ